MEKSNGNSNEDDAFSTAIHMATSSILPMVLRAAVELKLFDIMATSGHDFLSLTEIASLIRAQNTDALERILRFLASSRVLNCEVDKHGRLLYGLNPISKYFVAVEDGASLSPYILYFQDKVTQESWFPLKDAVLNGSIPFNIEHGMSGFEYTAKDQRFNELFNNAMHSLTTFTMKKIFEVYKGFEGLTHIIDVGGGSGGTLAAIVSKYPNIRGINFDLPHVIQDAPIYQGVEHIGGDMFESVPSGEVIFMKCLLHDWSDDQCLRILKNCWKSLSKSGKIIVVESLPPQYPETDDKSNTVFGLDLTMLVLSSGGKERTQKEYDDLAKSAGFARTEVIYNVNGQGIIEFYKI